MWQGRCARAIDGDLGILPSNAVMETKTSGGRVGPIERYRIVNLHYGDCPTSILRIGTCIKVPVHLPDARSSEILMPDEHLLSLIVDVNYDRAMAWPGTAGWCGNCWWRARRGCETEEADRAELDYVPRAH